MLREAKDVNEFMDTAAKGGAAYILYKRETGQPALLDFTELITKQLGLLNARYICDPESVKVSGKGKKKPAEAAGDKKAEKPAAAKTEKQPREPSQDEKKAGEEPKKRGGRRARIDRDKVVELKESGLTAGEIADKLGASVPGINTVIRELKEEGRL